MKKYAIEGSQNVANPATILGLTGSGSIQPGISFILMTLDASATIADVTVGGTLQRTTAAGTSTAVTPRPLLPGGPAAVSTAGENHTAEPTYTSGAELLVTGWTMHVKFQFQAYPGDEIYATLSSANGLGFKLNHGSSTVLINGTMFFVE